MKPKSFIILTITLSVLILTIVFFNSCSQANAKVEDATYGWNYLDGNTKYRNVDIDGHKYIILKTRGYHDDDIEIIHSESCSCKRKK